MRNNKAILDEAARSVRRTFIGSVAGTLTMLTVVGAAGAYGMPENLTAQALSAAMAKFNIKFPAMAEPAEAVIARPLKVAENTEIVAKIVDVSPVSDVAPEQPVVRTVPEVVAVAPVAPAVVAPPAIFTTAAPAAPVIAAPAA